MDVFLIVARYVVSGTLLIAASAKYLSPAVRAAAGVQVEELLGPRWTPGAAGCWLAAAEAVAGVSAAVPARLSVLPALAVLVLLTAGAGALVARGSSTPCACFGDRGRPLGARHVACDGALALLAGAVLLQGPVHGWPDSALAAGLGAAIAFLVSRLDDMVDVLRVTQPERKVL